MEQMMLVQQVSDTDPDVRNAAANRLHGTTLTDGLAAMSLVGKLDDTDPDMRRLAAYALHGTTITDPSAAQLLAMYSQY